MAEKLRVMCPPVLKERKVGKNSYLWGLSMTPEVRENQKVLYSELTDGIRG